MLLLDIEASDIFKNDGNLLSEIEVMIMRILNISQQTL